MSVRLCHQSKLYLRFESAILTAICWCMRGVLLFFYVYLFICCLFSLWLFGNTIINEVEIVKSFLERLKLD